MCRNANPPTLLLTLHRIVKDLEDDMSEWWRDYLRYRHRNKQWCGYGSDSDPYHFVGSESGSELFDIKFILYSLVTSCRLPGTYIQYPYITIKMLLTSFAAVPVLSIL
jgi:hypothetical protein